MQRILITGGTGMLGRALVREWTGKAVLFPLGAAQCDVRDAGAVGDTVRRLAPQWVVHTAAYTQVDRAEADAKECAAVNDRGTSHVALAAAACRARLVYVSTDYVFDGTKRVPYREDDATAPLNVYGATKLRGEEHARGVPGHVVVRTQGLFGLGKSFVGAILDAAAAGRALSVVDDVVTGVTYADDLARAIRRLVDENAGGTFHVRNEGEPTSDGVVWADFARAVLDEAGRGDVPVTRISAASAGRAATRPAYSVLDTSKLSSTIGEPLPRWRDALRRHLRSLPAPVHRAVRAGT